MEGGRSARGQAGDLKNFAPLIPITRLGLCDGRLKSAKNETARLVYCIYLLSVFVFFSLAEAPFSGFLGECPRLVSMGDYRVKRRANPQMDVTWFLANSPVAFAGNSWARRRDRRRWAGYSTGPPTGSQKAGGNL